MKTDSQNSKNVDDYSNVLGLPYYGKPSRKFASQLSTLLKRKFNVRTVVALGVGGPCAN